MTSPKHIRQSFWRHARAPHLEIRSTFQSSQSYKKHSHDTVSLGLMLDGETDLNVDGTIHRLCQGDMIVIGEQVVHACTPPKGQKRSYHMLYLDSKWCLGRAPNMDINSTSVVRNNRLYAQLSNMLAVLDDKDIYRTLEHVGTVIAEILCQHGQQTNDRSNGYFLPKEIKKQLNANLASPPSLKNLAHMYHCTPETVIRSFKQTYDITPKAYINNARVEWGKRLLRQGIAIADTAQSVGFSDQSAFHHAFVQFTAATPRQYQKSIFDNKS